MRALLVSGSGLDAAFEARVRTGLSRAGVQVTNDGGDPPALRIVLLPESEDSDPTSHPPPEACAFAVVRSRKALTGPRAWRLLRSGFADVLVWEEQPDLVETLRSRLTRFEEVTAILDSPLVRDNLVGLSPAWRGALRQVVETARYTDGALLITGETGTGKELVARLLHTLDARPGKRQLVTLDCTTVVPQLSGSEFFGHERGAFTSALAAREGAFALADQGTLFLDEVGELSLPMQAELLRVVQEKTYKRVGGNDWRRSDFRLVCATHRDLRAEEARGQFRLDFYHRIAASSVHLPPLRERREDILPLARHVLRSLAEPLAGAGLDAAVEEFLLTRDYPGNVRELEQLVRRIVRRHVGRGPLTVGDVPEDDRRVAAGLVEGDWTEGELENVLRRALNSGTRLPDLKEKIAEVAIELAIRDAAGNLQRAAIKLGVTDRALQLRRASRRNGRNGHDELPLSPTRTPSLARDPARSAPPTPAED